MNRTVWAAAAAAVSAGAGAQTSPMPFSGIPDLRIDHYEVSGRTAEEIRASLDRHPRRPRDSSGRAADAVTRWTMGWRWTRSRRGCDLSRARIEFSAYVLLPRLRNPERLPPDLQRRWRAYVAALERHEDGHVRYAWGQRVAVLAALRSSRCSSADDAAERVVDAIYRREIAYDRETRHGATQGAIFP